MELNKDRYVAIFKKVANPNTIYLFELRDVGDV